MKKLFWLVLAVATVLGCSKDAFENERHPNTILPGLASVVQLQIDSSEIYLEDYFMDVTAIDSFSVPAGLEYQLTDYSYMILSGEQEKALDRFDFWINGNLFVIPARKTEKEEVTLTFNPEGELYENVRMKGEMNSWNPNAHPMEFEDDIWSTTFYASPGRYQYIFIVDGEETRDPHNELTAPDGGGNINSLLIVGDPETERPFLKTHRNEEEKIVLKTENADELLVLWENSPLEYSINGSEISFDIPAEAHNRDRTHIRAWAVSGNEISNDVLIPLEGRQVVRAPEVLDRHDTHAWNMYFIMIDRFYDGNPENNRPLNDPEVMPIVDYKGGDLAGITKKIQDGYFDKIGVNALWLSPITQNPEGPYGLYPEPETKFSGYHGYWPVSSSEVDDRFGTEEEWIELLDTAHENGISVILDYVANHVHENHPAIVENPDWKTDLYLPDGSLNTERWDEHRLTTWFDTFMPTLDFSNPEVVEMMSDSALYWVKNYTLDGFRHDATKHIQTEFWRTLTRKIKEDVVATQNRPVFQIGETYGSRELIASYIGSGLLDSQFDFNIYDAGLAAFARGLPMGDLHASLQQSFDYYGYHNLMGYISGNHDKARFITLASGEVRFDEDAKYAGWNREIGHPQPIGYKKHSLNLAFIHTIPGIPVMYQGDEFGMPGADDPDNRRMMIFEEEELKPLELEQRELTSRLTHLRKNTMSLLYGNFAFLHSDEHTLAFVRNYFEDAAWIFFNNSDSKQTIEVPLDPEINRPTEAHFEAVYQINEETLSIVLDPHSFEILTSN